MKPPPYSSTTSCGQAHVGAQVPVGAPEGRVAGAPRSVVSTPMQLEDLLRRRPQVEDVAGGLDLGVALVERDLEADAVLGQRGGHAARSGADDGDASLGTHAARTQRC